MEPWKFILEHAAKEWEVIRSAPAASFILFALAFVIVWAAFQWRYAGVIEQLNARNDLLKEQVADYQERLGLIPPDKTAYSKLTNLELKKEVTDYVAELQLFLDRVNATDPTRQYDAEREQPTLEAMEKWNQAFLAWYLPVVDEYSKQYRTRAVVLRDELLRRLPPQQQRPPQRRIDLAYDKLAGPHALQSIVNDLRMLSSLLPDRQSS